VAVSVLVQAAALGEYAARRHRLAIVFRFTLYGVLSFFLTVS